MNIENGCFHTITKENKPSKSIKKRNSRNNIKRNFNLMNDPAFHLNKTLKEYISKKLNKNKSTEKNSSSKNFKRTIENKMQNGLNIIQKVNERYNNFSRIKTMSNILSQNSNKKKNISKKRKIKVKNSKSKTYKKMKKSKIKNKNILTNYIINSNNKNKNSKNKILNQKLNTFSNTFSNNSTTPKFYRYNGSNGLLNDTDINKPIFGKNINFTYSNNFNKPITNNSTLDVNLLKSALINNSHNLNSNNKNKFITKFNNTENIISNHRYNNLENGIIDNKNSKKMINIDNKININNNIFNKTTYFSDNNKIKKAFNNNNSVKTINNNIINANNNSDNNKKDIKEYYTANDFYKPNNNNKDNKDNQIIVNKENNDISLNNNNHINNDNCKKENSNSIEYLKKIEMLENENKFLKGEISESKNRLIILENKIGQLLGEKCLIEKEECPQPMPYVKKYSAQTCINFRPAKSPIENNFKEKEKEKEKDKDKDKDKKINIKNIGKKIILDKIKYLNLNNNNKVNKRKINKNKKYINNKKYLTYKTSMNFSPNKKSFLLKTSKSISCLRTRNNSDIHLKVNKSSKIIIPHKKTKRKSWKKFDNILLLENNNSSSKSPNHYANEELKNL